MSGAAIPFRKYYAEGNAYVVVEAQPGATAAADWIASATRGIGGDGLIVIEGVAGESLHRMRVFNADGSEAQWCGNGARAAAALLCERDGLVEGDSVTIAAGGGIARHVLLDRERWRFRAEMPVADDPIVEVGEGQRLVQTLIGAPHLVVFGPQPTGAEIDAAGRSLCASRPGGTNVMFAERDGDGTLAVTPWERGVGPVLGCATGAAAAAIAGQRALGLPLRPGTLVRQPGGEIEVEWNASERVLAMTGGARLTAVGEAVAEHADPRRPLAAAPASG